MIAGMLWVLPPSQAHAQDCRALHAVGESAELATLFHNTKRAVVSTRRAIANLETAIRNTYPSEQQKQAATELQRKAHTALSLIKTGVALTSKSGVDMMFVKIASAWGLAVTPHGIVAIVSWKALQHIGERGGVTGAQRRKWLLHELSARKAELSRLESAAQQIFQTMTRAKREYNAKCKGSQR